MIDFSHPLFARAISTLADDIRPTTPTSVDLVLEDDLPVRISLHPDETILLVDAFAFDASGLFGNVQAEVGLALLRLNGMAMLGRPFAATVTPGGLVAVTVRIGLGAAAGGGLADALDYAVDQARSLRRFLGALAPDSAAGISLVSA